MTTTDERWKARRVKLRALAEAHDAWVTRHLGDVEDEFDPDAYPADSDYNQHQVEVDADGAAQDELAAEAAKILDGNTPLTAADWDESKHPRNPNTGEFIDKGDVVGKFFPDLKNLKRTKMGVGKVAAVGKPMKINTKVIFNTKYANGQVVAVNKKPPGIPKRLIWNGDKFVLQGDAGLGWQDIETYTKNAAYKALSKETGWTEPTDADKVSEGGAPTATGADLKKAAATAVAVKKIDPDVAYSKNLKSGDVVAERMLPNGTRVQLVFEDDDGFVERILEPGEHFWKEGPKHNRDLTYQMLAVTALNWGKPTPMAPIPSPLADPVDIDEWLSQLTYDDWKKLNANDKDKVSHLHKIYPSVQKKHMFMLSDFQEVLDADADHTAGKLIDDVLGQNKTLGDVVGVVKNTATGALISIMTYNPFANVGDKGKLGAKYSLMKVVNNDWQTIATYTPDEVKVELTNGLWDLTPGKTIVDSEFEDALKAGPPPYPGGKKITPKKLKITTKLIHSTKYDDGAVVAVKYAGGDTSNASEMLMWDGKMYIHAVKGTGVGYDIKGSYTKAKTYNTFKDQTDWFEPPVGGGSPPPGTPIKPSSAMPPGQLSSVLTQKYPKWSQLIGYTNNPDGSVEVLVYNPHGGIVGKDLQYHRWNPVAKDWTVSKHYTAQEAQEQLFNVKDWTLNSDPDVTFFKGWPNPDPKHSGGSVTPTAPVKTTSFVPKNLKHESKTTIDNFYDAITPAIWSTLSESDKSKLVDVADYVADVNINYHPFDVLERLKYDEADATATPNTSTAPPTPKTNNFTVLPPDQRGKSGDGYYGPGLWGKYGAAGLLIRAPDSNGEMRYLLVERGPGVSSNQGKWQLPGGAIDELETHEQGAARELVEELAATPEFLASLTQRGTHAVEKTVSGKTKPWIYKNITATAPQQFVPTVDGHETSAAQWFTLDALKFLRDNGNLHPALAGELDNVLKAFNDPGPGQGAAANAPTAKLTKPKSKDGWPDGDELEFTGKTVGTHGSKIYRSKADGSKYLFKPNPGEPFKTEVDVVTDDIRQRVGLHGPRIEKANVDGQVGSLQNLLDGAEAYPGVFKPADLSSEDLLDLEKEHAFDWLISNHDSHPGNFWREPSRTLVGLDKGQAFRYFGQDRLDWDFHPNAFYGEREPVYNTIYKAYLKGEVKKLPPIGADSPFGKFLKKIQDIPDDEFRDMLRPYAKAAAKANRLTVGGQPQPGLEKSNLSPNDVEGFLDAAVKRKNSIYVDFSKLRKRADDQRVVVQPKSVDVATLIPVLPDATPSVVSVSTPPSAPSVHKPKLMSVNTNVIYKTTYAHGAEVAYHPATKPYTEETRLVWDAKQKKFWLQRNDPVVGWKNTGFKMTKKDAYERFSNEAGWMTPAPGGSALGTPGWGPGAPHLSGGSPAPVAPSGSPPTPIVKTATQLTIDDIVKGYGTPPSLNNTQTGALFTSFKNPPAGYINSSSSAVEVFTSLVQAIVAHNKAFPNAKLSYLQALRVIDVKNSTSGKKIYEDKIVKWLTGNSLSINTARDIIKGISADGGKSSGVKGIEIIDKMQRPIDIGKPSTSNKITFSDITVGEAAKMQAKMLDNAAWSSASKTVITKYTGSWYSTANGVLREKKSVSEDLARQISDLQNAMRPATKSFVVHRGTHSIGPLGEGKNFAELKQLIGSEKLIDRGFGSTSVGGEAAFTGRKFGLDIEVPEGAPVAYIKSLSSFSSERELLLAAGTKFKILDVQRGSDVGRPFTYVIRVRIIP